MASAALIGPGRRMRRRVLAAAAAVLLALGGLALWAFARVAAGFGAVVAAQHAFASGDLAEVLVHDHFRLPWGVGRALRLELDAPRRSARVTAFGLVSREAAWVEGLGAVRRYPGLPLPAAIPRPDAGRDRARASAEPWPIGDAAGVSGLDARVAAALDARLDRALEAAPDATRALLVVHRGVLVAERYRPDTGPDTPLLGWSMTKSFLATVAGRWIELGLVAGPDEAVAAPEWAAAEDPRRAITVEHLLRMTGGLAFDAGYTMPWSDSLRMLFVAPVAAALAADQPLQHAPGTHWSYSDGSSNLLARLLQERAGPTLAAQVACLHRELLEPLGLRSATLGVDPGGHWVGSSFLMASARDWARLGLLYLRDGCAPGGRRLLPAGWVEFVSAPTPSSAFRAYGAHFWRYDEDDPRDADGQPVPAVLAGVFYAAGYQDQFLWIDRGRDALVLRIGRRDAGFDPAAFAASVLQLLD